MLTRKVGQRILVGESIAFEVVAIDGKRIRIGIVAPEDVPIIRPDAKVQEERKK